MKGLAFMRGGNQGMEVLADVGMQWQGKQTEKVSPGG